MSRPRVLEGRSVSRWTPGRGSPAREAYWSSFRQGFVGNDEQKGLSEREIFLSPFCACVPPAVSWIHFRSCLFTALHLSPRRPCTSFPSPGHSLFLIPSQGRDWCLLTPRCQDMVKTTLLSRHFQVHSHSSSHKLLSGITCSIHFVSSVPHIGWKQMKNTRMITFQNICKENICMFIKKNICTKKPTRVDKWEFIARKNNFTRTLKCNTGVTRQGHCLYRLCGAIIEGIGRPLFVVCVHQPCK